MKALKKILKILLIIAAICTASYFLLAWWLRIPDPEISEADRKITQMEAVQDSNFVTFGSNRLRQSESGLWEMYVEGSDFERGVAIGKMSKELLKYQEDVFVAQIRELIPSDSYLKFLRLFVSFFNRKLPENVPLEYQREIYGISLSCTDEYNAIGTPYERQLNYHSAHDLGHAMQDYMLVGCTSFAAWDNSAADSSLIIGRNFDFYVGDDFAKNKVVSFYKPDTGYPFATVAWAGMTGVLSGMNKAGLTVTINAAKSSMPTSSATPISILCREILQYASTIDEAYAIAQKRKTFVSESILIGSAKDNRAAIIEKSPDKIGLFESKNDWLVCANHYQSEAFKNDPKNIENIATSDSPYRQQRAEELVLHNLPLNPQTSADILRDQRGLADKNIGMGNEKALNQLICHHSVIFQPQKGLMWVSTSPWQIGKYVAYDLNKIFANPDFSKEIYEENLTIAADTFLFSDDYLNFVEYKKLTKTIKERTKEMRSASHPLNVNFPQTILTEYQTLNPEFYYTYEVLGDNYVFYDKGKAKEYWQQALTKETPKQADRERILEKLNKLEHR
ncbi:MAG: C45 family peptidase [Prevotellaceae bacterium]|jgi:hypothetical protein|nr:C45 family peptidase [Prevotellaceae bacterium]